jgi:hypothetical protein
MRVVNKSTVSKRKINFNKNRTYWKIYRFLSFIIAAVSRNFSKLKGMPDGFFCFVPFFLFAVHGHFHSNPAFYNDIAPWMRFKKASNDAAVKNIIKIELPHILIYLDENSLN